MDQVTIVQQLLNGTSLLGGINGSSPLFVLPNFEARGQNVVLNVCDSGRGAGNESDWVRISISLDSNIQNICDFQRTAPPSDEPTVRPSSIPTGTPSMRPLSIAPNNRLANSSTVSPFLQSVRPDSVPTANTTSLFSIKATYSPTTSSFLNKTDVPSSIARMPPNGISSHITPPQGSDSKTKSSSQISHQQTLRAQPTPKPTLTTLAPSVVPIKPVDATNITIMRAQPTTRPTLTTLSPSVVLIKPVDATNFTTNQQQVSPLTNSACKNDANAVILIDNRQRTCAWLSLRPSIWSRECMQGKPAHAYCTGVCNSCLQSDFVRKQLSPATLNFSFSTNALLPVAREGSGSNCTKCCDSAVSMQYNVSAVVFNFTCIGLRARPKLSAQLCTRSGIKAACPETCGVCNVCADHIGFFNDVKGIQRTCLWLSLRYRLWGTYCRPDQLSFSLCPKTCENCAS